MVGGAIMAPPTGKIGLNNKGILIFGCQCTTLSFLPLMVLDVVVVVLVVVGSYKDCSKYGRKT